MNNNLVWCGGRKPTYVSLSSKMKALVAVVLMPVVTLALELNPSFAPEAVAKYREKADAGDPDAQYLYSEALANGKGVAKDHAKAMEYARKAAAQGFGLAFCRVAEGYEHGWGGVSNATEATRWYDKFYAWARPEAENGSAHAQFNIGRCCNGKAWRLSKPYRPEDARKWIRKAAELGHAEAQYCLANESFVEKVGETTDGGRMFRIERLNDEDAAKWYRNAAENGYAEAQLKLGRCYAEGKGVKSNIEEAVKWYRKAAEQGVAGAQLELGRRYIEGKGVASNYEEAVKWYRKAAEQGHAKAQFELAGCYAGGKGTKKNVEESARWYRKAAEQGHAKAQFELGRCCAHGNGVSRNDEEAVKWYSKAAGQGIVGAQLELVKCYWKGVGVAQDRAKAVKLILNGTWQRIKKVPGWFWYLIACATPLVLLLWAEVSSWWFWKGSWKWRCWRFKCREKRLRRAAESGNADAQYEVAIGIANCGNEKVEAEKWCRKAAEQGHITAQCTLGYWYCSGYLSFNQEESARWYRKAAEQGNAEAQLKFGRCCEHGKGVVENKAEAVKWYRKAAGGGIADAQSELDKLLSENSTLREAK